VADYVISTELTMKDQMSGTIRHSIDTVQGLRRQIDYTNNSIVKMEELTKTAGYQVVKAKQDFNNLTRSISQANTQLAVLGFGKTKKEIEAAEAEMYNLANVKMDKVKDEIKQLENGIKQMKESADSAQFTEQIKRAEEELAKYKNQLKELNTVQKVAELSGYKVANIFGKDVFYKPLEGLQKFKAQVTGFFNTDLAIMANHTYQTIDKAAKKIVGSSNTIAEQKKKITQLATAYDTLGMNAQIASIGVLALGYAVVKDMPSYDAMSKSLGDLFNTFKETVKPTLDSLFNTIKAVADTTTAFMQANPAIASFIGHFALLTGGAILFTAAFAPISALLIRHRGLFQAIGQSMVVAGKGGTAVLNPAIVAMQKQFQTFQKAIVGFPRILAGLFPAALTFLRALPGFLGSTIIQFVKLNPMLTVFSLIAMVAMKNWDRIGPILTRMLYDVKLALKPVLDAFSNASTKIMPPFMKIIEEISKIAGDVLVDALRTVETAMLALALVINGDIKGASGVLKEFGPLMSTVGGVVGAAAVAWGTYVAVARTVAVVQTAVNLAMSMNPIGIVVLSIGALVAAGVVLYQHWEKLKLSFESLWNLMKKGFLNIKLLGLEMFDTLMTASKPFTFLLPKSVRDAIDNMRSKVKGMIADTKADIASLNGQQITIDILQRIKTSGELHPGTSQSLEAEKLAQKRIDGSHANGLSYVPRDGYIAELHKGERVLTANENKTYNNSMTNNKTNSVHVTVVYNSNDKFEAFMRRFQSALQNI
jgi:hypothetical protein